MKVKCPKCRKEHEEKDYNFEWSNTGWKGKCPSCKTKLTRTKAAHDLVRNKKGQLIRAVKIGNKK